MKQKVSLWRERPWRFGCACLLFVLTASIMFLGAHLASTDQEVDRNSWGLASSEAQAETPASGDGRLGAPEPQPGKSEVSPASKGGRKAGKDAPGGQAGPLQDGPSQKVEGAGAEGPAGQDTVHPPATGVGGVPEEALGASQTELDLKPKRGGEVSSIVERGVSFLGIFALIAIAWLFSNNRRRVNWKLVAVGVTLQLVFAVCIFFVPGGEAVFAGATAAADKVLDFTSQGAEFIFYSYVTQNWEPPLINFTFAVLPTIIFVSALMTILYHLGIMQRIVLVFAWAMQRLMGTSGAESLSAAANIFVGQTEAPLLIKPYVDRMTSSELMTVMTGGFATVAGGVLAVYVGMFRDTFPEIAGHLLAASVMSAPAALVIGKIMYPEVEIPETSGNLKLSVEKEDVNVLDAASRGAAEGVKLAINVAAMLLAFIALIAFVNYLIALPSLLWNRGVLEDLWAYYTAQGLPIAAECRADAVTDETLLGCITSLRKAAGAPEAWVAPVITMQQIFGYIFWPIAWIMGVPASDCYLIGQLLGEKMVVNELVAYQSLQTMLLDPEIQLSRRSVIIATYALCGFANFGSIGIQLGGIGGIAPGRKADLARIAFRAMIAGTLAAFMTATVAGILVN